MTVSSERRALPISITKLNLASISKTTDTANTEIDASFYISTKLHNSLAYPISLRKLFLMLSI
jgi:hypothetical protein